MAAGAAGSPATHRDPPKSDTSGSPPGPRDARNTVPNDPGPTTASTSNPASSAGSAATMQQCTMKYHYSPKEQTRLRRVGDGQDSVAPAPNRDRVTDTAQRESSVADGAEATGSRREQGAAAPHLIRRRRPLPGGRAVFGGFLVAVAAPGAFAASSSAAPD